MSTVERNKGTLREVSASQLLNLDLDLNDLYDTNYMRLNDKYYSVEYEVESEEDCSYFVELEKCPYSTSDTYHFHTLHYNGGGSLEEILEDSIREEY